MNPIWKRKYILRTSDFDKFNRIKPSAVLELFQDAAGLHAEELGVGFDGMSGSSQLWVLTRTKFRIVAEAKNHQTVIVKTWPLKPGRLIHRRECCIEDECGTPLIVGSSEWVVIDSESRRPISAPELYSLGEDFCTDIMCEEKLAKVPGFEETESAYIVNAGFSEIDTNNHVNNTKYLVWAVDCVEDEIYDNYDIYDIKVTYRKEAKRGNEIVSEKAVYYDGNTVETVIYFTDKDEPQTIFAQISLGWKKR